MERERENEPYMELRFLQGVMPKEVRNHHLRVANVFTKGEIDWNVDTCVAIAISTGPETSTIPLLAGRGEEGLLMTGVSQTRHYEHHETKEMGG